MKEPAEGGVGNWCLLRAYVNATITCTKSAVYDMFHGGASARPATTYLATSEILRIITFVEDLRRALVAGESRAYRKFLAWLTALWSCGNDGSDLRFYSGELEIAACRCGLTPGG